MTTFRLLPGENAKFYQSVQLRIDATVDADVVSRKPAQWATEVVLHQQRLWRQLGGRQAPGAEKVAKDLSLNINMKGLEKRGGKYEAMTKTFVDNCITVYERVLKHNELLGLILAQSEVWDKLNKLHILVFRATTRENIKWTLEMISDILRRKAMDAEDMSGRQLKGWDGDKGLIHLLLGKRALRDQVLLFAQKEFNGWQPETHVKLREVSADIGTYRDQMDLDHLSWQQGWLPSQLKFLDVLDTVFGDTIDKSLRSQVNNHRSPSDLIAYLPEIKELLDAVKVLHDGEVAPAAEAQKPDESTANGAEKATPATQLQPIMADSQTVVDEPTAEQKVAASLFSKTPTAKMQSWITAAERQIARTGYL